MGPGRLTMFDDWQAFIAMGGHGLYVWMAYSAAVALLIANLTGLRAERRRTLRQLRAQAAEGGDAPQAP